MNYTLLRTLPYCAKRWFDTVGINKASSSTYLFIVAMTIFCVWNVKIQMENKYSSARKEEGYFLSG